MTEKDNPFFARMLVNRYWKHFMGRGLVEPEDDMRGTNPATNPDLLDALAGHFIQSGFDLKELIRTICRSGTYQRSSHPNGQNGDDSQNFSRYYPKRLTAEVLLDAIDQVTDVRSEFPGQPSGTRAVQLPDDSFNADSYFLTLFGRPNNASASESERTHDANLAQSLHLLNSRKIHDKVSDPGDGPSAWPKIPLGPTRTRYGNSICGPCRGCPKSRNWSSHWATYRKRLKDRVLPQPRRPGCKRPIRTPSGPCSTPKSFFSTIEPSWRPRGSGGCRTG